MKKQQTKSFEEELIIKQVTQIRQAHPRLGTRKIYLKLQPFFKEHGIKLGRDGLFNLLSAYHLLIRKRKKHVRTTQSRHWFTKYTNQIKDFTPTSPNQLWVSDITYWKVSGDYMYISLITDAYSHKVVGYQVAANLGAIESIQALKMALGELKLNRGENQNKPIHHSDRGMQYCSTEYVKLLREYEIKISMTQNGDPLENAVAERINGILKEEYLDYYEPKTLEGAKQVLKKVIKLYNNDRPHMSIGNLTPNQVYEARGDLVTEKLWKNYYQPKVALAVIE